MVFRSDCNQYRRILVTQWAWGRNHAANARACGHFAYRGRVRCLANGALFQAIGLAPNPGLPPVMYATSSMLVFFLSVALASSFPALFKPVVADLGRVIGIVLVLAGLFLLAGGKVSMLFRSGG